MTEADVEHATLEWLAALGWEVGHGPDGSPPDARTPGTERDTYRETALVRLGTVSGFGNL